MGTTPYQSPNDTNVIEVEISSIAAPPDANPVDRSASVTALMQMSGSDERLSDIGDVLLYHLGIRGGADRESR